MVLGQGLPSQSQLAAPTCRPQTIAVWLLVANQDPEYQHPTQASCVLTRWSFGAGMLEPSCTLLACHWLRPSHTCVLQSLQTCATSCLRQTTLGHTAAAEHCWLSAQLWLGCRAHKSGPSVFFRPVVAAWGEVQWETAKVSDRKQAASGVSTFAEHQQCFEAPRAGAGLVPPSRQTPARHACQAGSSRGGSTCVPGGHWGDLDSG